MLSFHVIPAIVGIERLQCQLFGNQDQRHKKLLLHLSNGIDKKLPSTHTPNFSRCARASDTPTRNIGSALRCAVKCSIIEHSLEHAQTKASMDAIMTPLSSQSGVQTPASCVCYTLPLTRDSLIIIYVILQIFLGRTNQRSWATRIGGVVEGGRKVLPYWEN